jgi:hypothetical protein
MAQPISTWFSTASASPSGANLERYMQLTWISLEPGVVVRDVPKAESESGWGMVVEINSLRVH